MANPTRRSVADVLLELLGKVPDAGTLEILLEPEHLLTLMRNRGASDDAIRAQLKAGEKLPGELLLDVLAAQPDCSVLLAELGNPAPRAKTRVAARSPADALPPKVRGVVLLVLGSILALPSSWYLFVRLDFLNVPGLIVHFPGAYALIFTFILVGGAAMVGGVSGLMRAK